MNEIDLVENFNVKEFNNKYAYVNIKYYGKVNKIQEKLIEKGLNIKFNDPNIQNLERSISDKIGLNVSIKNNKKNKGTITFVYHDIEQLNKIIDIIKSNY